MVAINTVEGQGTQPVRDETKIYIEKTSTNVRQ